MEDYIRESLKIQSFIDDLMNGYESKEVEFKSAHGVSRVHSGKHTLLLPIVMAEL